MGEITLGAARVRWSGRAAGHLGLPTDDAEGCARDATDGPRGRDADRHDARGGLSALVARRAAMVNLPWTWLHQVHGAAVTVVERPGEGGGIDGDALVTRCPGAALAVFTADCAPVVLWSPEGVVAVAHAGWRGLMAGVVQSTVDAMRVVGAGDVEGWLGPCIRPGCYEFGPSDLDAVANRLGDAVRATTLWGAPALDLPAAVMSALGQAGGVLVGDAGACTACSRDWYSHRARGDVHRQATVVWLPPSDSDDVEPPE